MKHEPLFSWQRGGAGHASSGWQSGRGRPSPPGGNAAWITARRRWSPAAPPAEPATLTPGRARAGHPRGGRRRERPRAGHLRHRQQLHPDRDRHRAALRPGLRGPAGGDPPTTTRRPRRGSTPISWPSPSIPNCPSSSTTYPAARPDIAPETIDRLAESGRFVALKESSHDLPRVMEISAAGSPCIPATTT